MGRLKTYEKEAWNTNNARDSYMGSMAWPWRLLAPLEHLICAVLLLCPKHHGTGDTTFPFLRLLPIKTTGSRCLWEWDSCYSDSHAPIASLCSTTTLHACASWQASIDTSSHQKLYPTVWGTVYACVSCASRHTCTEKQQRLNDTPVAWMHFTHCARQEGKHHLRAGKQLLGHRLC